MARDLILSQTAEPVAQPSFDGASRPMLQTLDEAAFWFAAAIAIIFLMSWIRGGRRDPLDQAPIRENRFAEDALTLAMLAYFAAALLVSTVWRVLGGDPENVMAGVLLGSGAQLVGLGVCLWIVADRFEGGLRRFWFGPRGRTGMALVGTSVAVAVLAFGFCPLVLEASVRLVERVAPDYQFSAHPTIKTLRDDPTGGGVAVMLWIGAAVIAPLAEEVFFRGLLQTFLSRVLGSRWRAILVTSVAFGAVHFGQPHAIPALILLSVFIGFAYERTGSMLSAVVIHAVFNLKTLIWDAMSQAG